MAVALVVLALHAVEVPDETSLSAASRTRFDAVVHLGVLLPISGSWKRGRTIAGAVTLAVERIELDASLLPGLRIQYEWLDAGCNVSQGITSLQALLKNSELSAVIGPGRLPALPHASIRCSLPLCLGLEVTLVPLLFGDRPCVTCSACVDQVAMMRAKRRYAF